MTTDLDRYTPPTASELDLTWKLAERLSDTEFVPKTMRGKAEAVLACILTGHELGIGPMQALRDVYLVNGRPSLAATLMVARVRAAGHRFRTIRNTDALATVQIHRAGAPEPEPPVEFTLDDAKRAKLAAKDVWQQYPARMCWARAASAACRRDAPECLGGVVYTPEELDAPATTVVTAGGAVVDTETGEMVSEPEPATGAGNGQPTPPAADTLDAWRRRATGLPNADKVRLTRWVEANVNGGWRWLYRDGTAEDWSAAFAAALQTAAPAEANPPAKAGAATPAEAATP
jgi:hypothetical protein